MPRRAASRSLALLLLLLAPFPPKASDPASSISVAAAANLKLALEELKEAFEAEHPGSEVSLTFGASGTFFAQIQNGAPFDVFLSADRDYPAKLVAAGLGAAQDEHVYAFGKLVAYLPPESKLDLKGRGLVALRDPSVKKIAIANPALAPFGRAAEEALKSAGVYDSVKDKLVLGTSVAQTAQFATTGAADVAFLPYSLTFEEELRKGTVIFVPENLYSRIEQSGLLLKSAHNPVLSKSFLDYLNGEKGRAVLTRFGYGLP